MVIKLVADPDDDLRVFSWVTNLVTAGSLLYLVPLILGSQSSSIPALRSLHLFFTTQTNLTWAYPILWISMASTALMGVYAVWYVIGTTKTVKSEES